MKRKLAITLLLAATTLAAQETTKPLSPAATAEATIDGKKITITYSAPSMRGRAIMGGLVPYDKVWRTGANAATTLVTEANLMIGSLHVPAGTYTLYSLPGATDWQLIVNKQTGQWGTVYDEGQDLGRVKMNVKKLAKPVETFVIGIRKVTAKSGLLTLTWENTEASVPLVIH